jgi:hypothetical protein
MVTEGVAVHEAAVIPRLIGDLQKTVMTERTGDLLPFTKS